MPASDELFETLCDVTTLTVGWHLAVQDFRNAFLTSHVTTLEYSFNLAERLKILAERLRQDAYIASPLLQLDVPKTGLSVRPGSVLHINDSIVLHSIVYLLAPLLDKQLDENVYSYRLSKNWKRHARKGQSLFREGDSADIPFLKRKTVRSFSLDDSWYVLWAEFEEKSTEYIRELGFTHLTKLDIASYFETIDLFLLERILRELLPTEARLIGLLISIFRTWPQRTAYGIPIERGIPQGNAVSSFLANLYLIPFDYDLSKFCKNFDAKWIRYVDDIKIFTRSYEEARRVIFLANDGLRRLHLTLQGSKTDVLFGERLKNEIEDTEFDVVNQTIKLLEQRTRNKRRLQILESRVKVIISKFTRKLPKSLANLTGKQSRLYRRCLSYCALTQDSRMKKSALCALTMLPDMRILKSTLRYLSSLKTQHHKDVCIKLLEFVENRSLPFDIQLARVLDQFRILDCAEFEVSRRVQRIALDPKRGWLVRHKAIEALVTLPLKPSWRTTVFKVCGNDSNRYVRRSAMLTLPLLGYTDKIVSLNRMSFHPDSAQAALARMWRALKESSDLTDKHLRNLLKQEPRDQRFINSLSELYIVMDSTRASTIELFNKVLERYSKTKSRKLKWHLSQLSKPS